MDRSSRAFLLAATMLAISATVVVAALQITDDGGEGCVARFDPTLPKRYPHEVEYNFPVLDADGNEETFETRTISDDFHWMSGVAENGWVWDFLNAERGYAEAFHNRYDIDTEVNRLVSEFEGRQPAEIRSLVVAREDGLRAWHVVSKGSDYAYYEVATTEGAEARRVLDPARVDSEYVATGAFSISPSGKYFAFGIDAVGKELFTLAVADLTDCDARADDEDPIDPAEQATPCTVVALIPMTHVAVAWGADSSFLYYTTQDETDIIVARHHVEQGLNDDSVFSLAGSLGFTLDLFAADSGTEIVLTLEAIDSTEVWTADASDAGAVFAKLLPFEAGVRNFVVPGPAGRIILTNADGADDYQIKKDDGPGTPWTTVVEHEAGVVLEQVFAFADGGLAIKARRNGRDEVLVHDGTPGSPPIVCNTEDEIEADFFSIALDPDLNAFDSSDTVRFRLGSITVPDAIVSCSRSSGEITAVDVAYEVPNLVPGDYELISVEAESLDGEMIPISIAKRWRGEAADVPRPTLVMAYGAYGVPVEFGFNSELLSLLDRGFVYAVIHARGGGERGVAWHKGGSGRNKIVTVEDVKAGLSYLYDNNVASPEQTVLTGTSAGAVPAAVIANEWPEGVAAIVAKVGALDTLNTLMDRTIPTVAAEWDEWGDPTADLLTFDYIRAYSPYDNVPEAATRYPHAYLTTSLYDGRVNYWEPAKYVARLRRSIYAAQTDAGRTEGDGVNVNGEPICLVMDVDLTGGHNGYSGVSEYHRDTAREYAFVLAAVNGWHDPRGSSGHVHDEL